MAQGYLPHPYHVFQVYLKQRCKHHTQSYARCPSMQSTRTCSIWCRGNSRYIISDDEIVSRQVGQGVFLHGTTSRPHFISPTCNYFKLRSPVGPIGCILEQCGCWDENWRPKGPLRKETAIQSCKERGASAECSTICIGHDQHDQTHLHGPTPEVDKKSSGYISLRDCQFPATHRNTDI